MTRRLLFSLTRKDFVFQVFRAGGKGGMNQNAVSSGVRIIHPASGAVGESREERSQLQNKHNAFLRLTETPKFKTWHRVQVKLALGQKPVDLDELMKPENLRVERYDLEQKRWVVYDGT